MSHQVTRRLEFDAGHRLIGHESKCAHLHGHRYVAEITVQAHSLDFVGRVVDFSQIKELVGGWIDQNWDHNMLLHEDDPLLQLEMQLGEQTDPVTHLFSGKKPFIFPNKKNPTAENIVSHLFQVADHYLRGGLEVTHIRLYETPNCWADLSRSAWAHRQS